MVDAGLYLAYALIGIAALASFIFPLVYVARNIGDAKKSLLGVGVLLLVLGLTYAFSSGEFYFKGIEKFDMTESGIKRVSAGLNSFYVLVVIAIVAVIYSEVSSIFK
ncbi:MAG: hypothetical protein WD048_06455 [Chitinophagales bacterium]